MLGPHCRFEPSCSHYVQQALTQWGLVKGGSLALKRLSKCHPFHAGGVDLVPEIKKA
jgi:putative membrane protein insertion efficiency factor